MKTAIVVTTRRCFEDVSTLLVHQHPSWVTATKQNTVSAWVKGHISLGLNIGILFTGINWILLNLTHKYKLLEISTRGVVIGVFCSWFCKHFPCLMWWSRLLWDAPNVWWKNYSIRNYSTDLAFHRDSVGQFKKGRSRHHLLLFYTFIFLKGAYVTHNAGDWGFNG